jgi:hypothetical protein
VLVFMIGFFLPDFGESILMRLGSLAYKSVVILGVFISLIRISNVSEDISNLIDQILGKIGIKLS